MWRYVQLTGELFDWQGHYCGVGYSGHGAGKNNPAMQNVKNVGPLPIGTYTIGDPFDSPTHGLFCLPLTAFPGNQMFGRSAFLMHGDSIPHPGMASEGCIVQARATRERVAASGDSTLETVSGEEDQVADADGEIAT